MARAMGHISVVVGWTNVAASRTGPPAEPTDICAFLEVPAPGSVWAVISGYGRGHGARGSFRSGDPRLAAAAIRNRVAGGRPKPGVWRKGEEGAMSPEGAPPDSVRHGRTVVVVNVTGELSPAAKTQ